VLGFLADRAAPAIERVEAGGLTRVVRMGGIPVVLTVRAASTAGSRRWLSVEAVTAAATAGDLPAGGLPAGDFAAAPVRLLVRRMLDLDTDLAPFLSLARRDPLLAPLVARHPGLRLPQLPDPFEGAVRAIVGQQVSVAAARTVVDRLIRRLGEPLATAAGSPSRTVGASPPGGASGAAAGLFAFPHPAAVAAASPEQVTALGLTRAKAAALIAVAAATAGGALDWERLRGMPPAAAQAALVALPGIGPWTASYVRMRALADADAFPASDLGVIKALASLAPPTAAAAIGALAERWRPFRAYAAIHLWRSLSADP
ncbi:MAG TPA: AlkA N-terminal domain-containing protein, partial [Thermoanaerobaculia bacterium]|nr:AlkA N-terminal domain-containing protein [Thermoanaerobaculia bacterium]